MRKPTKQCWISFLGYDSYCTCLRGETVLIIVHVGNLLTKLGPQFFSPPLTTSHAYKCSALHIAGVSVPCVGQPGPPKTTRVKAFKASPTLLEESFYAKKSLGNFGWPALVPSVWAGGGGWREHGCRKGRVRLREERFGHLGVRWCDQVAKT